MPTLSNHYLSLKLNANGINAQGLPYNEDEIKRAFRVAAIAVHPDKNPSELAAEQFAAVNTAYAVLTNPQSRAVFDTGLARNFEAYRANSHLILLDNESKPTPFVSANEPLAVVPYNPQGIDITALINNSNTGIDKLLEMAEANINFMQSLLDSSATWVQLSQDDQFKLFLRAFTVNVDNQIPNFANRPFIRVLLDNITNEHNCQIAFVKICEEQKFSAATIIDSGLLDLTRFSYNNLFKLSENFYNAAYALFQTYLTTLKTWHLDKFVNKYPQNAADLVRMIESVPNIQRKYAAFIRVRAGRNDVPALRALNPEMRLLGIETLDATYDLNVVEAINFRCKVFRFVNETAIDFARLNHEGVKALSREYCNWIFYSMKTVNEAVNGADTLKDFFTITARHKTLLDQMTEERFNTIIEELNLEIFTETSRADFVNFLFSFRTRRIVENEEKEESDAYPDLLKKLLSSNKEEVWEFLQKHNLLSEIARRNDYLEILIQKDERAVAYHFAKNTGTLTDAVLNTQSERFQLTYRAFSDLLTLVRPFLNLLALHRSASFFTPQAAISNERFEELTNLTGYFIELSYINQTDRSINLRILTLAFSSSPDQNKTYDLDGLKFIFLRAVMNATTQEVSMLLENFKNDVSQKLIMLVLTFLPDGSNIVPKIKIIKRILANPAWAKKYLSAGLLNQYHSATRECMVDERLEIDRDETVRTKIKSFKKLQGALELIKMTEVYAVEDLELIVGLIAITGFDKQAYELLTQNLASQKLLRDAVLRSILMKSEIYVSAELKTSIFDLNPLEINHVDMLVKFRKFAEDYLAQVKINIDAKILTHIVEKHGIEVLTPYPVLRAQFRQTEKLHTILHKLQNAEAKFESRPVMENAEIKTVHDEFRSFIELNKELILVNCAHALEIFDNLTFIKNKHDHPLTNKYINAFPKEEPSDILTWTINCALDKETFAQNKLNILFAMHTDDIAILSEKLLKAITEKGLDATALETLLSSENYSTLVHYSLKNQQKNLIVDHLIQQFDKSNQNLQTLDQLGDAENHFLALYFRAKKSVFKWPLTTENNAICRLLYAGYIKVTDIIKANRSLRNIMESSKISDYIIERINNDKKVDLAILGALPESHYFFYPLVEADCVTVESVMKWPSQSLELEYFKSQDCNDIEKSSVAIKFFGSAEFRSLRVEVLDFIEGLDDSTISSLHESLVENTLKIDFSNPEQTAAYLATTRAGLISFCIWHNATNPVVQNILNNFVGSGFDVGQLLKLYGSTDTNYLISYCLTNISARFAWPLDTALVEKSLICQLVLTGKMNLSVLTTASLDRLTKFDHPHVKKYLTHLLKSDRAIQMQKLFELKQNRLNVFPLVESNMMTIETANYFPCELNTLEGKILERYLSKTDWNNPFAMNRLKYIIAFLQSDHFDDIQTKISQPILAKEISLKQENTPTAKIKAEQMHAVNQAVTEMIETHLDQIYKAKDGESGIINRKVFSHQLNQDLIKTMKHYANSDTICSHRNMISKFLNLLLMGLTWFIKPLLSENTRNRWFSPASASTLYKMEDDLTRANSTTYKIK
jgi:hypothetical protein